MDLFAQKADEMQTDGKVSQLRQQDQAFTISQTQAIVKQLVEVASALMSFLDKRVAAVEVKNLPTSISTPDIQKAVVAIKSLEDSNRSDNVDIESALQTIEQAVKSIVIPKVEIPAYPTEMALSNQIDPTSHLEAIQHALESLEINPTYSPQITVKAAPVKVTNDFTPIVSRLNDLFNAVKAIDIIIPPVPKQDNSDVIGAVQSVKKSIDDLIFPVPNMVHPFKGSGGSTQASVDDTGALMTIEALKTNRYDLAAPLYYVGYADLGASESSTVWVVTLYDLTSNPYTGKVATDIAWSARVSAVYS